MSFLHPASDPGENKENNENEHLIIKEVEKEGLLSDETSEEKSSEVLASELQNHNFYAAVIITVNTFFMIFLVVGGFLSGSLAVLAKSVFMCCSIIG